MVIVWYSRRFIYKYLLVIFDIDPSINCIYLFSLVQLVAIAVNVTFNVVVCVEREPGAESRALQTSLSKQRKSPNIVCNI